MELNLPLLQIVGYQNSGKTTLVTKIVEQLTFSGVRVGTIKHHGHGGYPDAYDGDKDSAKHREAGAIVTGVEGAGMLQLHACNSNGWKLEEIVLLYERLPVDAILVEGFKNKAFPKIVLLRSEKDEELLEQLQNIKAVISWYKPFTKNANTPIFHINDERDYLEWTRSYFERKV